MLDKTKIKPTKDRMLIEKIKPEPLKSESGLITIESNLTVHGEYKPNVGGGRLEEKDIEEQDDARKAKVLAVGPLVTAYRIGQTVITNKYAGMDINREGMVFLVNENDILATLD